MQSDFTQDSSGKNTFRDKITLVSDFGKRHPRLVLLVVAFVMLCSFMYWWLHQVPSHITNQEHVFEIQSGTTIKEAAQFLKSEGVIRSSLLLQVVLERSFDNQQIKAGVYTFTNSLTIHDVATLITTGPNADPLFKITIHEGLRLDQIDEVLSDQLPEIEPGDFLNVTGSNEGYFFPDTYLVPLTYTAEDMAELMSQTFTKKILELESKIAGSDKNVADIITMASIIEREGSTVESKHLISGILWKRIAEDMPLQVDAVFEYIYRKPGTELTSEDLLIDSPYNTYQNTGLPPTPIVNPGLESIVAALEPKASDYYFYITAPDGTFHYAQTFEEHKANIARYLR